MADRTGIPWATATINPVVGCRKCSPGCQNCYAERMAVRLSAIGFPQYEHVIDGRTKKWNGDVCLVEKELVKPLSWKKPRRIFVCSMGDLFHPSVPTEWIDMVFGLAAACQRHTFLLLTKRPDRMRNYFRGAANYFRIYRCATRMLGGEPEHDCWTRPSMIKNIWVGTTVCNQDEFDTKVPDLISITSPPVRFLSIEPMLGPIVSWRGVKLPDGGCSCLPFYVCENSLLGEAKKIDWVIAGGENGHGARSMDPMWIHSLKAECDEAKIPFFFKGWGSGAKGKAING